MRPYRDSDLEILHAINQASTPGVSSETSDGLSAIINVSDCNVVEGVTGEILGFITLIEPGTLAYPSPNLRWFEAWQAQEGVSLIYVDRIAFAESARGLGLGAALYDAVSAKYEDRDYMTAEVNTVPDNPGSHRFHKRMGFGRVGAQVFKPGEKAVAYYARRLNRR